MTTAVIFDLDGTLLDTLESLAEAFNSALRSMGCPPHALDEYQRIIGDGARVAVERALPPEALSEASIQHCLELFRDYYGDLWRTATIYPGVIELLETQRNRRPLAVLSNKDQAFTQQCTDHFFPGFFDISVGFSDTVNHKPDPTGAQLIADHLQTKLNDLWMVGDTATDMKTASATGMIGVGVTWGFRDRVELETNGASFIIEKPAELSELLKRKKS